MNRRHMMMGNGGDDHGAPVTAGAGPIGAEAESQIRDEELYRMAAFRIRETANRIATLANSTQDEALRRELSAVCERLLNEERELLALTRKA
jgi:hypothetical protein